MPAHDRSFWEGVWAGHFFQRGSTQSYFFESASYYEAFLALAVAFLIDTCPLKNFCAYATNNPSQSRAESVLVPPPGQGRELPFQGRCALRSWEDLAHQCETSRQMINPASGFAGRALFDLFEQCREKRHGLVVLKIYDRGIIGPPGVGGEGRNFFSFIYRGPRESPTRDYYFGP